MPPLIIGTETYNVTDEQRKQVLAIVDQDYNPYQQTVEQQLAALKKQSDLGNWGITAEKIEELKTTAPAWPKGKDTFRSFRIRLGEGQAGVEQTFEAHWDAIKRVHEKNWRWENLRSVATRLRLLNGNETHKPVIEWVVTDLEANRQRKDIKSIRGANSLADEGLVLAWLFPERVEAIDYEDTCAWFLAGYEANAPEFDGESWRFVPYFSRDFVAGGVVLSAFWYGLDGSGYSVPSSGSGT